MDDATEEQSKEKEDAMDNIKFGKVLVTEMWVEYLCEGMKIICVHWRKATCININSVS